MLDAILKSQSEMVAAVNASPRAFEHVYSAPPRDEAPLSELPSSGDAPGKTTSGRASPRKGPARAAEPSTQLEERSRLKEPEPEPPAEDPETPAAKPVGHSND
jgi:hypothetical protein